MERVTVRLLGGGGVGGWGKTQAGEMERYMNVDAKCMNGARMRKHILDRSDPMLVKYYAGIIRRVRRNRRRAVCVCKRDVHALHRTAEQTSPAACREDNSRGFRRYQASCTSLHNELMSMAIPAALAPHNVRPALAAQSLHQQLLPLCICDVVPSYLKCSR